MEWALKAPQRRAGGAVCPRGDAVDDGQRRTCDGMWCRRVPRAARRQKLGRLADRQRRGSPEANQLVAAGTGGGVRWSRGVQGWFSGQTMTR